MSNKTINTQTKHKEEAEDNKKDTTEMDMKEAFTSGKADEGQKMEKA